MTGIPTPGEAGYVSNVIIGKPTADLVSYALDQIDQWMRAHPDATAFSEAWADRNLDELAKR